MVSGFLMQGRTLNWEYSAKKILGILRFTFIICISFWLIHSIRHGFDFMGFVKLWGGSFVQRGTFGLFWYFGAMILLYMILPYFNKMENRKPYFLPGIIFCFWDFLFVHLWQTILVILKVHIFCKRLGFGIGYYSFR